MAMCLSIVVDAVFQDVRIPVYIRVQTSVANML